MKYLIFSDTHLTHRFYPDKFQKLVEIISDCDKVIINGDFWDSYFTSAQMFVNSQWKELFPLLKQKDAVYIWGNHDDPEYSHIGDLVDTLSVSTGSKFLFKSGGRQFYLEHGHRVVPEMGRRMAFIKDSKTLLRAWNLPFNTAEYISLKLFNTPNPLKAINKEFFEERRRLLDEDTYYMVGHTHFQQYDESAKFINSGYIRWGLAQYCIVDDGEVRLFSERY